MRTAHFFTPIKDDKHLLFEHQLILSGVRKKKSYRMIARDVGKSLGMVQTYVNELTFYEAIRRRIEWKSGQGNRLVLTEKGEEICHKLNL